MISKNGLALIKSFESLKLKAYQDSNGIWTVGYGHCRGVTEGMTITAEQAEAFLKSDLEAAEARVDKAMAKINIPLFQNEKDALISQAFNLRSFEVLADHLKESETVYLSKTLLYCKDIQGHDLPGLKKRRIAEVLIFLGQEWDDIRGFIR